VTALQSDEQLLRLTLGGDARAFETLYDRLQGGIYRYALRMTGSQATAEDVTQEVFLSLIRDRCDYVESKGKFRSYLYAMARYRLMRRLERERNFVPLDGDEDGSEPVSCHDPVLSLPAHFREVFVLCYLQEMNYAEAGEIIDCPIGTVRSRLARARSLLVKKLSVLKTSEGSEIATAGIPVLKTT
jgi:RNA polymerase sigma-70 factor (ECF subfamily)